MKRIRFEDGELEREFGARIRDWRKHKGWSQLQLASALCEAGFIDLHQTTVSKIEAGTRPLGVAEAAAIAVALGLEPMAIFGPEDFYNGFLTGIRFAASKLDALARELVPNER